jgi:hypothetical protein
MLSYVKKNTNCVLYPSMIRIPDTLEWFLPTIRHIVDTTVAVPKSPNLLFCLSKDSAHHNMLILRNHGNSIQCLIQYSPGTFISPGSEFRPVALLEQLFIHHHNWPKIQNILQNGSNWPLLPISNNDRIAKNDEFVSQGNHKSAEKYDNAFMDIIKSEIKQGWMIPLPLHYINELQHGELAPVGIDDKVWVEQEDGSRKTKFGLTHDQSFEAHIGLSVNGHTEREKLHPLFYGGCLSRLIHYIISLRHHCPNIPILGGKSDFKAAYRRVSLHGDTAAKCSIICEEFALPSLCLTFGGTPCPNEFCHFSEMCTDLANNILHCKDWDPCSLFSPHKKKIPDPILQPDDEAFIQAKDLDVDIPLDLQNNRDRALQAILLAIHVMCRPLSPNEPIFRDHCLSLGKLAEEGVLSERLTILGWIINTRLLTITLPAKKYKNWSADMKEIIKTKKVSFKKLESTVGRLNHAAGACPIMRYFLHRIRCILINWDVSKKSKKVEHYLPK